MQYAPKVEKLQERLRQQGFSIDIKANDPELLQQYSPEKTWRTGSFEVRRASDPLLPALRLLTSHFHTQVIDTHTGELLYSKLSTGEHLVDNDEHLHPFEQRLQQLL